MTSTHFSARNHARTARSSISHRGRQLGFVALLATIGIAAACSNGKADARKADSAAGASAAAADSVTRANAATTHREGMPGEHGMEMRDSTRMRERRPQ
jgi:hypothetical protein